MIKQWLDRNHPDCPDTICPDGTYSLACFDEYLDCHESRPSHKFIERPLNKIRWALDDHQLRWRFRQMFVFPIQRMRRGYDDTIYYDISTHLACLLADVLPEYKKRSHGFHSVNNDGEQCTFEQMEKGTDGCDTADNWHAIVDQITEGLRVECSGFDSWDEAAEFETANDKVKTAWALWAKWHQGMWD